MRALQCLTPREITLVEIPEPLPKADELLIKPIATGICGTDLEIIDGGVDPAYIRYPVTLGHEWVGEVVSASESGTFINPGTRVVVEGVIPCEECAECEVGATNRCTTYDEIGFTRDGAAAERIVAPAHLAHVLSEKVSNESAVLVEPAAVVYQGLLRIKPKSKSRVLVVGDGTIALLAVTLVKSFAPASIDMYGLREIQRELALQAGATRFVTNVEELTKDYDYVVEAAGAIAAVEIALAQGKRGSQILLLGYPEHGARFPLRVHDLINNDLSIHASFSYTRKSWKTVVNLLNSGELDLTFIVTHRFRLDEWTKALETLKSAGSAPRGKVLLALDGD